MLKNIISGSNTCRKKNKTVRIKNHGDGGSLDKVTFELFA